MKKASITKGPPVRLARSGPDATAGLASAYTSAVAKSRASDRPTTAVESGAQLDDVQKAAGYADPGTTKVYNRRGYNPEMAASFFATY